MSHPLPTPSEMIAHLDQYVRGQARAKQDMAEAVYNHYLPQAYREREGVDLGRHHILLIWPTGVGKTYLVKILADFLGVPVGFSSAAGLVEAGYKGNSVETGAIQDSPLQKQKQLAAVHGITLELADDALDAVADEAAALGTGARGLHPADLA